eukprot:gene18913-22630_t
MKLKALAPAITLIMAASGHAASFSLNSPDIADQRPLTHLQEFNGFGCSGGNTSPALSWANAPAGTKSFAITVYDPDAPTGSGWWHWTVVNLPVTVSSLPSNCKAARTTANPASAALARPWVINRIAINSPCGR